MMDLPAERLSTTDKEGRRVYLYPADVAGAWRTRRTLFSSLLLFIFLVLPWIKVGHYQALLFDIPRRRFAIFGLTFWAHDAPLLFFIIAGALLTLALVTAIWGRIWCGWACPQTVFVEQLFRRVERFIEGPPRARRELDEGEWNYNKYSRKGFKWLLFTALALGISHSFIAYFVGTDELARMIASSPAESPWAFGCMGLITSGVLFDFGWFREQFCTVLCPYGRFQSVLMDNDSMVVHYDTKRGEPRRGFAVPAGDCVNCLRCVQVCPTGIDIRRGVQLECIACTSCIDACDAVMTKIKKPQGLIRYEGSFKKIERLFRPRVILYFLLLIACVAGLSYAIQTRTPVEVVLVRATEAPYQELQDATRGRIIVNHFKADVQNQTFDEAVVRFLLPAALEREGYRLVVSNHAETLKGGAVERADLFLEFPAKVLSYGHGKTLVRVESKGMALEKEVTLVGPFK